MKMKLVLKTLRVKNFKGCKDKEIKFDGNTKILGANATGKSTTADAWYWLMADCNTALVKNPPITPLGESECISSVEAEIEIDDKPCTIAKSQKFKSKEVDGKVTTSVTNIYAINSVEKSYKDFVADLTDRGIDMENFLTFSHPAAFTNDNSKQGREKMRSLLFKMCEGVTDSDIADKMEDITELKKLLDTYKLEEVEQMQKSTLKKIKETVGASNEIINARIEEVLSQKSTLDVSVLTEQKKNYEAEIERIEKELSSLTSGSDETSKKILELNNKKNEIMAKLNNEIAEKRTELEKQLFEYTRTIDGLAFQSQRVERELSDIADLLKEKNADIEKQRNLYKIEQDTIFDENELKCPVCKRKYSAEKSKTIKAEFEENKTKRLEVIKASGEDLKAKIKALESDLKGEEEKLKSLSDSVKKTESMRADIQSKLDALAVPKESKEIQIIDAEIARLGEELAKTDDSRAKELQSQKNVNKQMLNQVIAELGSLEKNKELDARVEELRAERKDAEIRRANAEKILDEVERFKKAKNDKLSSEINKHFTTAQFRLFKTLKNGSTEDACDVLVNGKEINSQVNQATQVIAKLDIIRGISDYFENWMPVFVDDFALFTTESEKQIAMNNQLIKLVATDGIKELEIERG